MHEYLYKHENELRGIWWRHCLRNSELCLSTLKIDIFNMRFYWLFKFHKYSIRRLLFSISWDS